MFHSGSTLETAKCPLFSLVGGTCSPTGAQLSPQAPKRDQPKSSQEGRGQRAEAMGPPEGTGTLGPWACLQRPQQGPGGLQSLLAPPEMQFLRANDTSDCPHTDGPSAQALNSQEACAPGSAERETEAQRGGLPGSDAPEEETEADSILQQSPCTGVPDPAPGTVAVPSEPGPSWPPRRQTLST